MISNHNGRRYKFRIYVNKVDCLVPKFSNGRMNEIHEFDNGYQAFYEKTTEKNGVVIEWEVKKHNRDVVSEAISSQLMYFDNVTYHKHNQYGGMAQIDIKSKILYSDAEIAVPSLTTKHTSVPHILLGREGKYVNYGPADFGELELPNYDGGIGFKMLPSDVSIGPSRENLVWNEKTKSAILAKFEVVKDLVNTELKDQLTETDFVKWNVIAENINANLNRYTYNSYNYVDREQTDLVSVLSKLLTTGDGIALKYSTDYSYKSLSKALKIKDDSVRTAIREVYVADKSIYRLNRNPIINWKSMADMDIWVTEDDKADKIRDLHICKGLDANMAKSFILIHKNKIEENVVSKILFESKTINDYDDLEVPEADRLIYQNKIAQSDMSPAEIRKLEKKVVAKKYSKGYGSNAYTDKVEYKIGDMMTNFTSSSVIYGHRDDDEYLRFMAKLLPKNTKIKILLVAQNNLKYFKPYGKYVLDYLLEVDEDFKSIKISDDIIDAIRSNYIKKSNVGKEFSFLNDLKSILPNEFDIYDKILSTAAATPFQYHKLLTQFSNNIENEKACNVSMAPHTPEDIFTPLQKLLDDGYTLDYIDIKEYEATSKLLKKLNPISDFLNDVYNLKKYSSDLDLYLTAKNYKKLDKNHGWI